MNRVTKSTPDNSDSVIPFKIGLFLPALREQSQRRGFEHTSSFTFERIKVTKQFFSHCSLKNIILIHKRLTLKAMWISQNQISNGRDEIISHVYDIKSLREQLHSCAQLSLFSSECCRRLMQLSEVCNCGLSKDREFSHCTRVVPQATQPQIPSHPLSCLLLVPWVGKF